MLERQVLRSVGWSAAGVWIRGAISILTLIVLARLLNAEDYGVFALAFLVVGGAALLLGGPMAEAITQERERDDCLVQATFSLTLFLSVVAWALLALAAPALADLFATPELEAIIPVFGVYTVIVSLASVPAALLMRDLNYGAINRTEVIAALAGSSAGISAASSGAGPWSLVVMELTQGGARLIGLWVNSRFKPEAHVDLAMWRATPRRNWGSMGAWSLKYLGAQIPRAVIGYILGSAALGLFVFAGRFFERVAGLLLKPIGSVALSAVSRAQDDKARLHNLLAQGLRASSLACAPAFFGLAAVMPVLVPPVFGDRWIGAVLPAQILLLIGLRAAIGAFDIAILRGVGQHAAPVLLLAVEVAGLLLALPIAAQYGLSAACYAILVVNLVAAPYGALLVARHAGFSISRQLAAAGPAIAAAAAMAVAVVLVRRGLSGFAPELVTLAVCVAIGVGLYGTFVHIQSPDLFRTILDRLGLSRHGASKPQAE